MTVVRRYNLVFADRKIAGVRVGTLLVVLGFVLADLAIIRRESREFSPVVFDVGILQVCLLICSAVAVPGRRVARGILSYLAIFALILTMSGKYLAQTPHSDWEDWRWVAFLEGNTDGGICSLLLPGCIVGLSLVGLWIARQRARAPGPIPVASERSGVGRQFSLADVLLYTACLSFLFACIAHYLPYPAWPFEWVLQTGKLLHLQSVARPISPYMSPTIIFIMIVGYPTLYAIVCWTSAVLVYGRWSLVNKFSLVITVTVIVSVVAELFKLLLVRPGEYELQGWMFLLNNLDNLGSILVFALALRLMLPRRAGQAPRRNVDSESAAREGTAPTPIP